MSCYPLQVVSRMVMNRSGEVFYIGGNDVLPAPLEPKREAFIHFTFFHSIGKEQGMMLAVTFERLCIQTPAEVVCIDNPVFAFSFETSAFGKEYEVLLNSRLL